MLSWQYSCRRICRHIFNGARFSHALLALQTWVFALAGLTAQTGQAQQHRSLSGTFWLDLGLNLVVFPGNQERQGAKISEPEALIRASQNFVRDEASYVFHGMVYGFQVVYRPPDHFHRQDETFLVIPKNTELISPTDLDIYHVSNVGHRFYYSIRKQLSRFEDFNVQSWEQADKKTLQARGVVDLATAGAGADDSPGNLVPELMIRLRKTAIDNGIKEAIRRYFRRQLRNKPAQIQVGLAFSAVPEISVDNGAIVARVRLSMGQYTIDRYEVR